jgi:hypothetical protein
VRESEQAPVPLNYSIAMSDGGPPLGSQLPCPICLLTRTPRADGGALPSLECTAPSCSAKFHPGCIGSRTHKVRFGGGGKIVETARTAGPPSGASRRRAGAPGEGGTARGLPFTALVLSRSMYPIRVVAVGLVSAFTGVFWRFRGAVIATAAGCCFCTGLAHGRGEVPAVPPQAPVRSARRSRSL